MKEQSNDYILYPKTVVQLSEQLKKLCDDYWGEKISLEQLNVYIKNLNNYKEFFKEDKSLNSSVTKIIGAKRTRLIIELFN